jgi:restriction system protein
MARSSAGSSDWERQQRQQAREAERQRRAAAAAVKAAEQAKREQRIAAKKAEAERRTNEIGARAKQLESILSTGLRHDPRINFESLKRRLSPPAFDASTPPEAESQPKWEQYAPSQPGVLGALFGGRERYQQRVTEAHMAHWKAVQEWRAAEYRRRQRLEAARRDHEEAARRQIAEAVEHNRRVDRLAAEFTGRNPATVERLLGVILDRVPLPNDFPRRAEVTYSKESEQALVQVQLPGRDVVPTVRGYRYVQSRDELQAVPRPAKEIGELYRFLLAQLALLVIRVLFVADPRLASVGFNGHVDATNPGTGQSEYPCLISLDVKLSAFREINLHRVRPEACLRHLRALVSPHPYDLEPITPILDFDLTKFSFVEGMDAVSTLDSRPDLMKMNPTEFEHLVRQIFEAMGVESWTTERSYDDGVDAVVVNRSPLLGRLSIVQAKRYKNAIGPNHIRELSGAIEEKKAGHGILVTTSWFTARSWQKAREHGRIELIDGNRLRYLIKEHLGKDVLIGVKRPRTATTGPTDYEK